MIFDNRCYWQSIILTVDVIDIRCLKNRFFSCWCYRTRCFGGAPENCYCKKDKTSGCNWTHFYKYSFFLSVCQSLLFSLYPDLNVSEFIFLSHRLSFRFSFLFYFGEVENFTLVIFSFSAVLSFSVFLSICTSFILVWIPYFLLFIVFFF